MAGQSREGEIREADQYGDGLSLLPGDSPQQGCVCLLRLRTDAAAGLQFPGGGSFDILIKESDLRFGNWKKAFGYLR